MTTDSGKNDNDFAEHEKAVSPETVSACEPGCACGEPVSKGNTKLKVAVCLVVIVAIAGILVLKTTNMASTRSGGCGPGGCPPPVDGKAAVPCN